MTEPAWRETASGKLAGIAYVGCPIHGETVCLLRGRLVGRCSGCELEAMAAAVELGRGRRASVGP